MFKYILLFMLTSNYVSSIWMSSVFQVASKESTLNEKEQFSIATSIPTSPNFNKMDLDKNNRLGLTTYPAIKAKNINVQNCPEGLIHFQHFLSMSFCYTLTKRQPFPPHCPYENHLEHGSVPDISNQFQNQSLWIPAIRNISDGFEQFKWLEPTSRYLRPVLNYENPDRSVMEQNCMVQNADKFIPVFCHDEYPALCIYGYSYNMLNSYCTKRNNFSACLSVSLNLDNKCYCRAQIKGMQAPRKAFCNKFAEPLDPFQNHLLLTQLAHDSPCWMGVEHLGNAKFQWSSSSEQLNYTFWKESVDFSKRYGALDYSKPKGWILENDEALKCGVCEVEVAYQNVTVNLRHVPNENSIEIHITNIFDIHTYYLSQYILACFSDYNVDDFTLKVVTAISDYISIQHSNYMKTIRLKNYYPSYYWCETIQRPNLTPVTSNKILVYNDIGLHGHEYSLVVAVVVPRGLDPYLLKLHTNVTRSINDTLRLKTDVVNMVRPMKILELSQERQEMNMLLHISSTKNNLTHEIEFETIFNVLQTLPQNKSSNVSKIIHFSRSELCLAEKTTFGNDTLHWPETMIGVVTLPKELCLQSNSAPVTRRCEGDFLHGGTWGSVEGSCAPQENYTNRTLLLYGMLNSQETAEELGQHLCEVTENEQDVLTVEVHYIAEILEKLSQFQKVNLTQVVNTLSNIMKFKKDVLKFAQTNLNSTDKYLDVLDKISARVALNDDDNDLIIKSNNLIVQISDLTLSNVTGAMLKREIKEGFDIEPLYNNVTIEYLLDQNIDLAVFLPDENIEELQVCMQKLNHTKVKLVIAFFRQNTLFNEAIEADTHDNSKIINVFIPQSCTFKNPIPIVFKPFENAASTNCGHWNYGHNEKMENIHGNWRIDVTTDVKSYAVCRYYHTTHFALLMYNENRHLEYPPNDVIALNIITALGCALSLLGLSGIFITAIAFKNWRKRSRNIIMLNFSGSLAAQMILLFISDNVREDGIACIISGASLHYTVLAEFAWMLIVAILQYRKFVTVFPKPIPHLILKCSLVGWCLPSIPVIAIFIIDKHAYAPNAVGLCYPNYAFFQYAVILPVASIIVINLFVFFKIIISICRTKVEAYGPKDNDTKLQLLLAILLFFLLGMSWIFGLASAFAEMIVFSYLFCLTATLQGFVIFIFFVVMNEKARYLWLNIKQLCYCAKFRIY